MHATHPPPPAPLQEVTRTHSHSLRTSRGVKISCFCARGILPAYTRLVMREPRGCAVVQCAFFQLLSILPARSGSLGVFSSLLLSRALRKAFRLSRGKSQQFATARAASLFFTLPGPTKKPHHIQPKYHVPLGVDDGAWLGQAYPRPPPRLDQWSP
jgi:hypothetical protein